VKNPKIVLWDIETCPNTYEHINILPEYNSDRFGLTLRADVNTLLCFGYKYLGEKNARCINVWDFKSGEKDINSDKEILIASRKILEDADGIVTHNGASFDLKFFNTRLVMNGLSPLPNIPHMDTKRLAQSKLFFIRNRLDYLAEKLDTARKMENGGWKLWTRLAHSSQVGPRCPSKEQTKKDKRIMSKYCAQDVQALEKLFLKLRPFATNMPNHNIFNPESGGQTCPKCGSSHVQRRGQMVTASVLYQRFQCQDCGSWSKQTKKGLK
jgi:predicted RNA-binding Zn-ribbon protein involved in translation (DUF1610 family)